jgi:dolichol kinase
MIQNLLIFAVFFSALIGTGEVLYRFAGWKPENSRKFTHASVGLLALTFPLFFDELWPVVFLCGSFFILLLVSMRLDFLPSINKVKRQTVGSIIFPVIVAVCFWLSLVWDDKLYYYIPILILSVCDPLASSLGNSKVEGRKSFRGSMAFFISATLITAAFIYGLKQAEITTILVSSLAVGLATTFAEYIAKKGWDNFSIPVFAVGALYAIEKLWI